MTCMGMTVGLGLAIDLGVLHKSYWQSVKKVGL
jgi:hypothetical protein